MSTELLIYGLVAAGLVFWLRSVLGTRHGEERERPNPFATNDDQAGQNAANNGAQSMHSAFAGDNNAQTDVPFDWSNGLDRTMSILDEAKPGLDDIHKHDRYFDALNFLRGAEDAFIAIVESFAEGDRDMLKGLLSEDVYKAFDAVITEREEKDQKASAEILAVRDVQIQEAWVHNKIAFITVRFVADETNLLMDNKGLVIEGNPEKMAETRDIWTFGRGLKSKSPAWLLYQTRDEDAADQEHKTVPDADDDEVKE